MKRFIYRLTVFAFILIICSCAKYDYSVRFVNNFSDTIDNVKAGNAFFGTVEPGKTTDYKPINGKSFLISGMSVKKGQALNGSESMSGKGTHKWTITLNEKGTIDFTEDQI